ncbi:MAG: sugar ABC transporter ATP-binding protein [Actinomycetota bacterium]
MNAQPIVEVRGASVRFAGDIALDNVDFRLYAGEVHSLMGENGAGKSTLIRAITGVIRLDAGAVCIDGEPADVSSPLAAQRAGISTVYQEIDLLPNLSVAENVMLGREPHKLGRIDWKSMRAEAATALARLGVDVDPASTLSSHRLATQQLVAIARALTDNVKVLVLDEPTSSLDQDEVAELFRVIRSLKAEGVAILFVSHFLEQVYEICDRITVLRNGHLVGEYMTTDLLRIELVQKMLGHESLDLEVMSRRTLRRFEASDAESIVSATQIVRRGSIEPSDLQVFEGELLGIAGLLGSGRTELARLISGVDGPDGGVLKIDGVVARFRQPRDAMRLGVVYSSENRKTEGIIGALTVRENITLALQAQRGWLRRIPRAREDELSASWIEALEIHPSDPERLAGQLSGGNQQKVMLARLLALAPRLLVLDEPTRGIDIGAKVEIQKLVTDLVESGMSVIFISAELEEVLRVSHRVLVLRDRRIIANVDADSLELVALLAAVSKAET